MVRVLTRVFVVLGSHICARAWCVWICCYRNSIHASHTSCKCAHFVHLSMLAPHTPARIYACTSTCLPTYLPIIARHRQQSTYLSGCVRCSTATAVSYSYLITVHVHDVHVAFCLFMFMPTHDTTNGRPTGVNRVVVLFVRPTCSLRGSLNKHVLGLLLFVVSVNTDVVVVSKCIACRHACRIDWCRQDRCKDVCVCVCLIVRGLTDGFSKVHVRVWHSTQPA